MAHLSPDAWGAGPSIFDNNQAAMRDAEVNVTPGR